MEERCEYDKGREDERAAITIQFRQRQKLKDMLHELNSEYRRHTFFLYDTNDKDYQNGLNSEYPMLNLIYAKQFIEQYELTRENLSNQLEELESILFDITEGRF